VHLPLPKQRIPRARSRRCAGCAILTANAIGFRAAALTAIGAAAPGEAVTGEAVTGEAVTGAGIGAIASGAMAVIGDTADIAVMADMAATGVMAMAGATTRSACHDRPGACLSAPGSGSGLCGTRQRPFL
jgi:hypothetical protein